jgi:hypothetical protein
MSKKKKKKEPRSSAPAAEAAVERDEQEAAGDTETASGGEHEDAEHADASDAGHGDDGHGHGHGGHDPVEDDRPRNGLIAFVTLITCVTLIAFCIFVRELFNAWGHAEVHAKVLSAQSESLKELRASEKQKLTKYQWVSQKDGVVRIPTDRAIELTIAAYRNPLPAPEPPKLQEPAPKPEDTKPEDKPEEKKGEEGKDEKGSKDEKKGEKKDEKKGDLKEGRK